MGGGFGGLLLSPPVTGSIVLILGATRVAVVAVADKTEAGPEMWSCPTWKVDFSTPTFSLLSS